MMKVTKQLVVLKLADKNGWQVQVFVCGCKFFYEQNLLLMYVVGLNSSLSQTFAANHFGDVTDFPTGMLYRWMCRHNFLNDDLSKKIYLH
jgi:hypothetical protein